MEKQKEDDRMKCINCGKEHDLPIGMISAFSPIWNYCEECIEKGKHEPTLFDRIRFKIGYLIYILKEKLNKDNEKQ